MDGWMDEGRTTRKKKKENSTRKQQMRAKMMSLKTQIKTLSEKCDSTYFS